MEQSVIDLHCREATSRTVDIYHTAHRATARTRPVHAISWIHISRHQFVSQTLMSPVSSRSTPLPTVSMSLCCDQTLSNSLHTRAAWRRRSCAVLSTLQASAPKSKCKFDHTPLSANVLYVLKFVMLEWPCAFKDACRRPGCFNGHVCQDRRCAKGKNGKCRFGLEEHETSKELAE
jgi:hypothetical protein